MKIKKEINLFAGMFTAEKIYRYGDIILLLGHIIYLVLFYRFGVYQMVYYNYFSVAFYAVMYFLLHFKKIGKMSFTYLVLGEIIVHACMGAYYIGWSAGFTQIMLCIIPIPFFISQNRKAIPYILSSFDVVVFIVMRIIVTNRVAPYSFDTNRENILYIYNTLCSFIIIIYVSSIYIFTNEHNKREAKAQNEKLQKLATIDPLTQLFNRRAMMDFIKKIESNSRRTNSVYSMCLGDIDDFKHVNDTYGHEVGDEVLRVVSDVIAGNVPSEGYVCRWGGEEILFVVPNTDTESCEKIAKSICQKIHECTFKENSRSFNISMTFGVYSVTPNENYDEGISKVDKLLYKGKNQGKNCVVSK